jgi:hypothetical protein
MLTKLILLSKFKKIYALDFAYLAVNVLLFAIPFFLEGPQIIVGTIVNFLLIYTALNFKQAKLLPAIFLPAIAGLLRGTVLGTVTVYLGVLMPFIWVANGLFVLAIRGLVARMLPVVAEGKKLFYCLGIASIIKVGFLFAITFALVSLFNFPQVLLLSMGAMQLATAMIGSVLYLLVFKRR